jgi:hypothetical protein
LNELDFVYLRVICVAEAWLNKVKNDEVNVNDLLERSGKERVGKYMNIGVSDIEEILGEYQSRFEAMDSMKGPS